MNKEKRESIKLDTIGRFCSTWCEAYTGADGKSEQNMYCTKFRVPLVNAECGSWRCQECVQYFDESPAELAKVTDKILNISESLAAAKMAQKVVTETIAELEAELKEAKSPPGVDKQLLAIIDEARDKASSCNQRHGADVIRGMLISACKNSCLLETDPDKFINIILPRIRWTIEYAMSISLSLEAWAEENGFGSSTESEIEADTRRHTRDFEQIQFRNQY